MTHPPATEFDAESFRIPSALMTSPMSVKRAPRPRRGELFLRGPIAWAWWEHAGRLPGKAVHVALVLWLEAGLKKSRTVQLSMMRLRGLGVDRQAARRCLRRLAAARLVSVEQCRGRLARVTLLDAVPQAAMEEARPPRV